MSTILPITALNNTQFSNNNTACRQPSGKGKKAHLCRFCGGALQKDPRILSPADLMQKDGEPVWVEPTEAYKQQFAPFWGIVDVHNEGILDCYDYIVQFNMVGTVVTVYAYQPFGTGYPKEEKIQIGGDGIAGNPLGAALSQKA